MPDEYINPKMMTYIIERSDTEYLISGRIPISCTELVNYPGLKRDYLLSKSYPSEAACIEALRSSGIDKFQLCDCTTWIICNIPILNDKNEIIGYMEV
jgi:hypothetical protein